MSRRPVGDRLYGALLYLYPAEFRRRYGAELRETFRRRATGESRRRGTVGAVGYALRACADVPFSALRLRLHGGFSDDIRFARRSLRRSPLFTASATLILAMGIGAGVSVFSVLNAVVLAPLPYAQPDRLAIVWALNIAQQLPDGASWPTVQDWRLRTTTTADVAAYNRTQFTQRTLTGSDKPVRLQSAGVSTNFFELLGVEPILGRVFAREENTENHRLALISHRMWQQRFGGGADVIGKTLELDGEAVQIIGVMPAHMKMPTPDTDVWEPLFRFMPGDRPTSRWSDDLVALARLNEGVTIAEARADFDALSVALRDEYPEELDGLGASLRPLAAEVLGTRAPGAMWLLFAAVLCVLLVACTNVANLVLARGLDRGHEFAVRAALGAGRSRLVRQLLVENALLALGGAILGIGMGFVGVGTLVSLAPADTPRLAEVGVRPAVALATIVAALVIGPLFGLPAALWAARRTPQEVLKSGARTSAGRAQHRLRQGLVVGEVALAIVLMAAAVLLVRSLGNVWAESPGFEPDKTLVMRVDLLNSRYSETAQIETFYRQAVDALRALPGVEAAGAVTDVFRWRIPDASITAEGQEPPGRDSLRPPMSTDWVLPGYFEAMGIELRGGRFFEDYELGNDPRTDVGVAIINETMAEIFWPGEDAVGKRFQWGRADPSRPWLTVVGVVADTRSGALDEAPISSVFTPFATSRMHLVVRTEGDPMTLIPSLQAAVRAVDADAPLSDVTTAASWYADSISQRRFQTLVLVLFGIAAVALAAVGIFAVMHDSVLRRRREIGIRMAVGAKPGDVQRMVLREGLLLSGLGMGIGLAGSIAMGGMMASFLYDVSPTDPPALALAAAALLLVAMLASLHPARNATRVDPIETLKQ